MTEERDAGLKRALGPWALGANVVNVTVGAGIFVLPAALYREIGAAAPLAYLACTVMMAGVVICFAAAGSRVPTSGGAYGFVQEAFGAFMGFLVGILYWLSTVLAVAGVAAAVADILGQAVPFMAQPLLRAGTIIALLGALAAVNLGGAGPGARLVELTTLIKLLPLAALVVLGLPHLDPGAAFAARGAVGAGFGRAMLLAIFAFQGMETAIGVSGEVREPARNIPRGLLGAMAAVAALYILLQLVVQGALGPALATSKAPLVDAARAISGPLGIVLLVGATASMVGYLAGDALSSPRTLFAFGRDGFLPRAFGGVNARGAPTIAILAHTALAAALAFSGGFVELVTLSALATVTLYVIGCAAAVVLQRRGTAHAGPPFRVPALWLAAVVGIGGMIWLVLNAKPAEMFGLAATAAVSGVLYAVARLRKARAPA